MKIKHFLLLTLLTIGLNLSVHGQASSPSSSTPPDYSQPGLRMQDAYSALMNTFYDPTDTTEGNNSKKISYWKHFWNDRVSPSFPSGKNEFSGLAELARYAIDSPASLCSYNDGNFDGNWLSIGPDTLPNNLQSLGLMNAVWASPTDSNYILAGSGAGGLWKTTDGGQHWANITDNAQISGTFGVGSIAVNPNDQNEIWVSTPSHFHLQGQPWFNDNYHYGVIYTLDGGNTWQHEPFFVGGNGLLSIEGGVIKLLYSPDGNIYAYNNKKIFMKQTSVSWGTWATIHQLGSGATVDTFFTDIDILPQSPYNLISSTNSILDPSDNLKDILFYEYNPALGTIMNTYTYANLAANHDDLKDMSIPNNNSIHFSYQSINGNIAVGKLNRTIGSFSMQEANQSSSWFAIGKLIVSPADTNVMYMGSPQATTFGCCATTYMSINGGLDFYRISTYWGQPTHGDIRDIYLQTASSLDSGKGDLLFIATDGGIAKKSIGKTYYPNYNSTCSNINGRGLAITQFYGFADQEGENKLLAGGAIHTGMFACDGNEPLPWSNIRVTDATECEFDAVDRDRSYFNNRHYSIDLLQTYPFGGRRLGRDSSYALDSVMKTEIQYDILHPIRVQENSKRMYIGKEHLWVKDVTIQDDGNWYPYGNNVLPGVYHPRGYSSDSNTFNNPGGAATYTDSLVMRCFSLAKNNDDIAYLCYFGAGANIVNYTADGGASWFDRTPSDLSFSNQWRGFTPPVSSITISDSEPNKVWLGRSEIEYDQNQKPTNINRILYSNNSGISWTQLSTGLPPHPVTALVYQAGSDDIVYAGTDVGVYRFVKQEPIENSYWVCFNDGFPKSLINDLEINYCSGKLRAATHGRGIWESDLYQPSTSNIGASNKVEGGGNTIWTGERYIEASITVKAGNTLTIQGTPANPTTIYMPKWGRINVEKGASLVVDGATITNSCNTMWNGIFIDGDDNASQIPITNQGICQVKNGAIIENSENGVANHWNGLGGGIIIANDAIFRNNRRSSEFLKYQGLVNNTTIPKADLSYFKNCTFIVNDDYPTSGPVFTYHMSMWATDRVKVTGCSFDNQITNAPNTGRGIFTLDGSIMVNETSNFGNPSAPVVPSTFSNLQTGIDMGGYNFLSNATVLNSDFNENNIGVQMQGHDNGVVGLNNFQNLSIQHGLGLYANECPHYNISENDYIGSNDVINIPSYGVWITNTYANDNFVYKNTFKDFEYANVAEEYNHGYIFGGGAPRQYGLRYNCNTNTNNFSDFYIGPSGTQFGIHSDQLSISSTLNLESAGNTFTQNPSGWDIANYGQAIRYYHSGGTTEPIYTTGLISKINSPSANCEAYYNPNNNPADFPPSRLSAGITKYNALHAALVTALYNHEQLIDDGNTNQMVSNVTETWNEDAWTLRNNLLAESPYLSNEVLRQTGEENILPQAMYLEIIVANPDASREAGFLDFLQYELANPFPAYMIDIIVASWSTETYRTSLENTITLLQAKRSESIYEVIQCMMHSEDETQDYTTDIATWLDKVQTVHSRFQLCEYYLSKGQTSNAQATLIAIPTSFELSTEEQTELTSYTAFFTFKLDLQTNAMSIHELNEIKKTDLTDIAEANPNTYGGQRAQNALCFFYNDCVNKSFVITPPQNKRAIEPLGTKPIRQELKVYPNPAKSYVVFDKKQIDMTGELIISDVSGRVVQRITLEKNTPQYIWDTRSLNKGIYSYKFTVNGGVFYAGKVTILE